MKNNNFKWNSMIVAIIFSVFITACNNPGQEQSAAEEGDEMNMEGMGMDQQGNNTATADLQGEPVFMQDYMKISKALLNDKDEQVKQTAADMQKSIEDSKLSREQRNQLKESAGNLAQAQDIKTQRQAFGRLSQQLYQVVQNNDVTDKPLYWQHCAMAMGGEGANWLSYNEKVQNPYMGQRMPRCGSVKETIQ